MSGRAVAICLHHIVLHWLFILISGRGITSCRSALWKIRLNSPGFQLLTAQQPLLSFPSFYLTERRKAGTNMQDFLGDWYFWIKAMHIVSVISWMAGLFYLPRLFVYHTEQVEQGSATDLMFQTMERRLLRGIMGPASVATWLFGLGLVFTPGIVDWSAVWPWTKAAAVLGMTWFHHWLMIRRKDFMRGTNIRTGRDYRIMNEVPTVLLLVIVFSVVLKF